MSSSFIFLLSASVFAADVEPIAYIGHGAFFDHDGREIEMTPAFVAKAQAWYRKELLSKLPQAEKSEFAEIEKRLAPGMRAKGQARLVVQQHALDWLAAHSEDIAPRISGKLKALKYELQWKLDARKGNIIERFELEPNLEKLVQTIDVGRMTAFRGTWNTGYRYLNECSALGVPVPPAINVMDEMGFTGWKSQGFIPKESLFIEKNLVAELRTYG